MNGGGLKISRLRFWLDGADDIGLTSLLPLFEISKRMMKLPKRNIKVGNAICERCAAWLRLYLNSIATLEAVQSFLRHPLT